jgi:hypothetical protein
MSSIETTKENFSKRKEDIRDNYLFIRNELKTPAEARKAYWGGIGDGRQPTPQEWQEVKNRHISDIEKVIYKRGAISSVAVDSYKIKLPKGYTKQDERYIFKLTSESTYVRLLTT